MKAAIYTRHDSTNSVQIADVEKPVLKDNEVLIKVRAASVNPFDCHILRHPFLHRIFNALSKGSTARPGRDVAGEVVAVGQSVTQFKPGDEVFGSCGGAFADYACSSESALVRKPDNVAFEQAASVTVAGLTALQGLRDKGQIQPGQKVLINGAAGGVGTFTVQIAKWFGAEATGVCSTRNLEMVRSIGADRVIDYTREDFTQSGQRYDLIFDLVANHPLLACRRALNSKGIYVAAGVLSIPSIITLLIRSIAASLLSLFLSQKFVMLTARVRKDDLAILSELMNTGKVTPVIDRRYSLSEVPEAMRYLDEGHARGKVVIGF